MEAQKFIWRPNNLYGGPKIYMEAQKIIWRPKNLYGCPIIYMEAQSEVERKTLCEYCWKQSQQLDKLDQFFPSANTKFPDTLDKQMNWLEKCVLNYVINYSRINTESLVD